MVDIFRGQEYIINYTLLRSVSAFGGAGCCKRNASNGAWPRRWLHPASFGVILLPWSPGVVPS